MSVPEGLGREIVRLVFEAVVIGVVLALLIAALGLLR
jgi:hypothetical protein